MKMYYSIEPRDRIYLKGSGCLSFAKNIGKNLSDKCSLKLLDSIVLKNLQEVQLKLLQKEQFKQLVKQPVI